MTDKEALEHQKNLERLRKLRPIDDDFMRCLFKDNIPLAQLVLRIITGKPDLIITSCQTQKDMKRLAGARSVCLDAYGSDPDGTKYDLEVQRQDKGADPYRARYHSSVLDIENLSAGQEFHELPETYTIFITEKDIFGEGDPIYPVERINLRTGKPFGDGAHILYVNGSYRGDSDIGRLMHDFCCNNADDMNFSLMADRTRYLKENTKGVTEMCKILEDMCMEAKQEGRMEGRVEGRMEGIVEGKQKLILRMLNSGRYTLNEIADLSGLPLDQIKQFQAEQGL